MPRADEDADEILLNRLNDRDPRYDPQRRAANGRNGGGCLVAIAAGASITATYGAVGVLIAHLVT